MLVLADSFIQRNGTALSLTGSLIFAAVGWALVLFVYFKGKKRKHLDYRVVSDIPILASGTRPEELKVIYGPLEVKNPRVTELRFWNTGNQVIDQADFMGRPFLIPPRPDARLLDFNLLERPTDLVDKLEQQVGPNGEYDPDTLMVYPKTLNAREQFTVQLVYDGGEPDWQPTVKGRIRDQTRDPAVYRPPEARNALRDRLISGPIAAALGAGSAAAVSIFVSGHKITPLHVGVAVVAALVAVTAGVAGLILRR